MTIKPLLLLSMLWAVSIAPLWAATANKERGVASFYAEKFHGRTTANGERFDMYAMTAAHRTLPFNTWVRVTNLKNDMSIIVRINDRGPFVANRVIDLSKGAAARLDMLHDGIVDVLVEVLSPGEVPAKERKLHPSDAQYVDQVVYTTPGGQFIQPSGRGIQLGSYQRREAAVRAAKLAFGRGFKKLTIAEVTNAHGTRYRLLFGEFHQDKALGKAQKAASLRGYPDAFARSY